MRNSDNITFTKSEAFAVDDETTWSLSGAAVGFVSWLFALAIPFLVYGPNTLFFPLHLAILSCIDACSGGCGYRVTFTDWRQIALHHLVNSSHCRRYVRRTILVVAGMSCR